MKLSRTLLAGALLAYVLGAAACAESTTGTRQSAAAGGGVITMLHASKCGKCHAPPEPQSHSRDELEAAFGRHRERVRLTTAQWAAMLDYLAPPL